MARHIESAYALAAGDVKIALVHGDRVLTDVRAVFPGAFNPLHKAHRRMASCAADILGEPLDFEISLENVDKPPLTAAEIADRIARFDETHSVWLTSAATFIEKSRLFPPVTFVVGADTITRMADVRYYAANPNALDAAIDEFASRGCRFLVFGRIVGERFLSLDDLDLPSKLADLCTGVSQSEFRLDIASREIRAVGPAASGQ